MVSKLQRLNLLFVVDAARIIPDVPTAVVRFTLIARLFNRVTFIAAQGIKLNI